VRLRSRALTLVGVLAALGGGCRCKEETLPPVSFEDMGDRGPIDPNSVLAPAWEAPAVSQLDNGALLHWLEQADDPAFHIRVLLPTAVHGDKLGAAGTAAALEAIDLRLGARLRRVQDAEVELSSRPGRIEIAIHGRDSDAERLIAALAETLADAGNPKLLAVAQGKVLARHQEAGPSALAAASLVSELLGHPLSNEYASKQDVVDLSRNRLERAWAVLTDPRDALVIVHAGRSSELESIAEAIERLGNEWKAPIGFGSGKPSVTARLRGAPPKVEGETMLLTETEAAPLLVHSGEPERGGRAVVMLGRLIPTPTAKERTLARVAQRLLQEELDVRLLVAGPVSLLAVRVRVSPSDPILSLERIIDRMQAFIASAPPRNRLEQATDLWLGARVVRASLEGEDWTALWSESIDLAGEDREIFGAIARDAQAMLQLEPTEVQEFMAQWFDPQGGRGGWKWVAAGVDANFRTKLGARLELVDAPSR
jgi:hypothetical protein